MRKSAYHFFLEVIEKKMRKYAHNLTEVWNQLNEKASLNKESDFPFLK